MKEALNVAIAVFSLSAVAGIGLALGAAVFAEIVIAVTGKGRAVLLTYSRIDGTDKK